jgi:hypothetical protein
VILMAYPYRILRMIILEFVEGGWGMRKGAETSTLSVNIGRRGSARFGVSSGDSTGRTFFCPEHPKKLLHR